MRSLIPAYLIATTLGAAPCLAAVGDIGIHHPFATSTEPITSTGSAFLLIHNHGDEADRFLGAFSPAAERVEIHAPVEKDGVVATEPVDDGIAIPANHELHLTPDGPHLVFVGLTEPFEDGDVLSLTLLFERYGEMTFRLPVDFDRLGEDAHVEHGGHGS